MACGSLSRPHRDRDAGASASRIGGDALRLADGATGAFHILQTMTGHEHDDALAGIDEALGARCEQTASAVTRPAPRKMPARARQRQLRVADRFVGDAHERAARFAHRFERLSSHLRGVPTAMLSA
jgi:hypothetical protein